MMEGDTDSFRFSLDTPTSKGTSLKEYVQHVLGDKPMSYLPKSLRPADYTPPFASHHVVSTIPNSRASAPTASSHNDPPPRPSGPKAPATKSSSKSSAKWPFANEIADANVQSGKKSHNLPPHAGLRNATDNQKNKSKAGSSSELTPHHKIKQADNTDLKSSLMHLAETSPPPPHPTKKVRVDEDPEIEDAASKLSEADNKAAEMKRGRKAKHQTFVDITEYLDMPQLDAAARLGIPNSTLCKRWKEAVQDRKWPYRTLQRIDKEIMTLLHNVPQGANAAPINNQVQAQLARLLTKRQQVLKGVVIRL